MIKSSDRTLQLLQLLSMRTVGMTHAQLGTELQIPKSSLTQLIKSLSSSRYVAFDTHTKQYFLGEAARQLGERMGRQRVGSDAWLVLVQSAVQGLADATGEGASFSVVHSMRVTRIVAAQSRHVLAYRMDVGASFDLHTTSVGKLVLARMSGSALKRYFARRLAAPTSKSKITLQSLQLELSRARKSGVAYSLEEQTPGVVAMAVPVLRGNKLVGAINVAMPRLRFKPAFEAVCLDALNEASERLAMYRSP